MITYTFNLNLFYPVPPETPFKNESFEPSIVSIERVFLVAFEDDEEATGFKLAFLDSNS